MTDPYTTPINRLSSGNDRFNGIGAGLAIKAPVVAVSTMDIDLSGEQTIGAIAVVAGDRVLVTGQDDATENGLYCVSTTDWSRTADFDGSRDVVNGTLVVAAVPGANTNLWELTSPNPVVIGTSDLNFSVVYDRNVTYGITQAETDAGLTLSPGTMGQVAYTQFPPGVIDRYGHNAVPGTTDMTLAVEAAIEQARADGSTVGAIGSNTLGGIGGDAATYLITSTVDFRPVPVQLDPVLIMLGHGDVGIIAGGNGNTGNNPTQWFGEIRRATGFTGPLYDNWTTPSVRLMGVYEQHVHIRKANLIQHYADNDSTTGDIVYRSAVSLYGFVTIQRCESFQVADNPLSDQMLIKTNGSIDQPVINGMYYTINRLRNCEIIGTNYGHNDNNFYGGNFEPNLRTENPNATITITGSCHANTFHNIRGEGYPNYDLANLASDADSPDTVIVLDNATEAGYFYDGKEIGIVLDTSAVHWTTVNGPPAGTSITLTDAMPSLASTGNVVRTRGGCDITFGAGTHTNRVIQTWTSSYPHWETGAFYGEDTISTITDDGIGNVVTTTNAMLRETFIVGAAYTDDVVLNNQLEYAQRIPSIGVVKANWTATGAAVIKTRRFRVFQNDIFGFYTDSLDGYSPLYRVKIYCFDSEGKYLAPVEGTDYDASSFATQGNPNDEHIGLGTGNAGTYGRIIPGSRIAWMYFIVDTSYNQVTSSLAHAVYAYVSRPYSNGTTRLRTGHQPVAITQPQPHPVSAIPTQGFAPIGYQAQITGGAKYTVTNAVDTWLTTAVAAGTTIIVEADVTAFTTGDIVGILNDNNYVTEWTTLTGTPTGTGPYTCQIADAVTGASAIGNRVVFVEWT